MSAEEILKRHSEDLAATTNLKVEVFKRDNNLFVLVHGYVLPQDVASVKSTDILFIADLQYPISSTDMFWTDTAVTRPDGSFFEGSTEIQQYLDRAWRRFSYHRNSIWNPAGNPLLDHFAFMETRWTKSALR